MQCMTFWKYFRDDDLQHQYESKGFVIVEDFVDAAAISDLASFFRRHDPLVNDTFYATNLSPDAVNNREIDIHVKSALKPYLDHKLVNYRCVIGLFYVKPCGERTKFHIHTDWSLVDERYYSSLHLWLPLVDITPENGNMFVYQGSHKNGLILRGSPNFEHRFSWTHRFLRLTNPRRQLYMKAGSALLFDHRLRHGSRPNRSGSKRVAVGISILPASVPLIHYHRTASGKIEVFEVPDDFYLDFNLEGRPDKGKLIGIVDRDYPARAN